MAKIGPKKHTKKHTRALKLAMKGGGGENDPGARLASGKHARTAKKGRRGTRRGSRR